jgi:predicted Zn-dependent protease
MACTEQEKPVTKEEAMAVARSLEESMSRRSTGKFNELFDLDALNKRIREQSHNTLHKAMVDGALSTIKSGELSRQMVISLGDKGTYQLVKQYEKGNHQHLVFRLYNQQLNYHDYELIKKGDKVKISDIFIYVSGENLSTTYAESLQSMEEHSAAAKNIDNSELGKIQRIKNYLNHEEYQKADELFKTLPALIRNQKLYKIIYIKIASGLQTDKYLAELNRYQQEYPDAPNMYLLMIDAYVLKKDYAGALKCVNSLDSLINKDPFLDYFRGLIYKQMADRSNQVMTLENLHKNMPDFGAGTLELINAYLEDKQLDKAVTLTQTYNKQKDADQGTIQSFYVLYPDYKKKMETAN